MFRPPLCDARPAAGRLADLRAAGREDRDVAVRLLDPAERADEALGDADANKPASSELDELAEVRRPADVLDRVVLLVDDAVRGLVEEDDLDEVDRDDAVRGLVVDRRVVVDRRLAAGRLVVVDRLVAVAAATAGFAVDMVLAAAVSALAAVVMALVAVFMACIADDMVFADVVALVAAAVIFVAADVTLVAAEDTVLAADAGVVELLDDVLRVEVLLVDRDAGLRAADEVVLRVGLDAVLRVERDDVRLADDATVRGRLAVPDALRLADLLRPVLAELRRLAALVRFWIATDFPPS